MHLFGVVQAHRTSSNIPKPHHYRDKKVCRVLSHEFGVVRPYRTVSVWCEGCLCTSSGCFKHIQPRRTFPNHIITEIEKCVEFCHMSSGWFDHTEPSLSTSLQGQQGMQGAYALVRGGSSTSNLIEPSCTCSGWFKYIEPRRTFSNHIITKIARCVEFYHMSSGWFDCTEHSLSTSLQR